MENTYLLLDIVHNSIIEENKINILKNLTINNKNLIMRLINYNYNYFEHFSDEIKDNTEIVIEALALKHYVLKYISDRLKDEEEIVIIPIIYDPYLVRFISYRLRNNEHFYLKLIDKTNIELSIEYAGENIKNNNPSKNQSGD